MQKTLATLNVIFVAFVFSSLIYLIVGFALSQSHWKPFLEDANLRETAFWLFIAVAVSLLFAALKLKAEFFKEGATASAEDEEKQRRFLVSRYIVLFAIAEIPAILGLVYLFLSGNFLREIILCAVSLVTFVFVKPAAAS